jgi:hypothetical protein
MAEYSYTTARRSDSYAWQTQRPLNCLVFVLPLLMFFQVGTIYYGTSLLAPRDLGRLLGYFGATAGYLPAVLIVAVLLAQHLARRDKWQVKALVQAGMFGESILWMIPLIVLDHTTRGPLIQAAVAEAGPAANVLQQVLVAVGAGVYEEFIFRLGMICLAMLIFVDVFELPKEAVAIGAVVVAACLFSLYHVAPDRIAGGGGFPWGDFAFRAAAGAYLGAVFILRGFAVAVGTHTFFNLYVVYFHLA